MDANKRKKYSRMMSAHRNEWTNFARRQVSSTAKKETANVRSIFSATSSPQAASKRINSYFKGPARKQWETTLRTVWSETGKAIITFMHGFLTGKSFAPTTKDPIVDTLLTAWDLSVKSRILAGGEQITGITDTTKDNIMKVIADGVQEGKGHYAIGQDVEDQLDESWARRGEMISRTEANSAMNAATLEASQAAAPQLNKVWVTTGAPPCNGQGKGQQCCRQWHYDVDNKSVPQDEPFIVMDEEMMYPGDPAGSGANVINCACCLSYEKPEEG